MKGRQVTSQLRRATAADVANIRALTRSAYAKWVPLIGREPLPMTADYDSAVADHIIDVWQEDGQLVALIEVIPTSDHLLIENIAVRPDQQGKGLGDKLLRHAERVAHSLGFHEIRLYTNAAFASNLSFYSRRGYQEYRRGTVVAGSVTVFMRKSLEARRPVT
jgi:N-acetylglutamate synthase-like GNAT family acetyltransferase